MAIANAQLTLTDLEIVTVPADKTYAITNILVCNNSATNTANFDLHFLSGQPRNNNITRVINNLELPAGETFTFDSERIILEAGDKILFVAGPQSTEPGALAGDTSLSATVSYLEV